MINGATLRMPNANMLSYCMLLCYIFSVLLTTLVFTVLGDTRWLWPSCNPDTRLHEQSIWIDFCLWISEYCFRGGCYLIALQICFPCVYQMWHRVILLVNRWWKMDILQLLLSSNHEVCNVAVAHNAHHWSTVMLCLIIGEHELKVNCQSPPFWQCATCTAPLNSGCICLTTKLVNLQKEGMLYLCFSSSNFKSKPTPWSLLTVLGLWNVMQPSSRYGSAPWHMTPVDTAHCTWTNCTLWSHLV